MDSHSRLGTVFDYVTVVKIQGFFSTYRHCPEKNRKSCFDFKKVNKPNRYLFCLFCPFYSLKIRELEGRKLKKIRLIGMLQVKLKLFVGQSALLLQTDRDSLTDDWSILLKRVIVNWTSVIQQKKRHFI